MSEYLVLLAILSPLSFMCGVALGFHQAHRSVLVGCGVSLITYTLLVLVVGGALWAIRILRGKSVRFAYCLGESVMLHTPLSFLILQFVMAAVGLAIWLCDRMGQ